MDRAGSDCCHVRDPVPEYTAASKLDHFESISQEDLQKLIKESPTKSSALDPIPTWLLKKCLHVLLPVIHHIINKSLQSDLVPSKFKGAIITPLLKKAGLDVNNFKSYRPVSNLSFVSKTLERAVASQLKHHLTQHQLLDQYQSAYRAFHSMETALLKVQNDILLALDHRK